MVEFNPDGSIRISGKIAEKQQQDALKMESQRCMRIEREIASASAPKKCKLRIILSDAISENRFVSTTYEYFRENASVPSALQKIDEKHFEVEIGTDFRRCSDCTSLIGRFREFMDGNIIEKKGACTFQGRNANFCYEDYFS